MIDALKQQLTLAQGAARMNLRGLDHGASLRAPEGGGNGLNWVLGHLVYSRSGMLALLDATPSWVEELRPPYGRGSAPITEGQEARPFEELQGLHRESHEVLLGLLDSVDPEWTSQEAEGFLSPDPMPAGLRFASLVFHESYHVGQLGSLRRSLGQTGAIQ